MSTTTNLKELGLVYAVHRADGTFVKKIRVIEEMDILDAAVGDYDPKVFGSSKNYLEIANTMLTGFVGSISEFAWYTCTPKTYSIDDIASISMEYDVNCVIVEVISDEEDLDNLEYREF